MRRACSAPGPLLLAALLAAPVTGLRAQGAAAPDAAAGARLRLETELRESNLEAQVARPTFARGDAVEDGEGLLLAASQAPALTQRTFDTRARTL